MRALLSKQDLWKFAWALAGIITGFPAVMNICAILSGHGTSYSYNSLAFFGGAYAIYYLLRRRYYVRTTLPVIPRP